MFENKKNRYTYRLIFFDSPLKSKIFVNKKVNCVKKGEKCNISIYFFEEFDFVSVFAYFDSLAVKKQVT